MRGFFYRGHDGSSLARIQGMERVGLIRRPIGGSPVKRALTRLCLLRVHNCAFGATCVEQGSEAHAHSDSQIKKNRHPANWWDGFVAL